MAIDANGKIVVVGVTYQADVAEYNFAVVTTATATWTPPLARTSTATVFETAR